MTERKKNVGWADCCEDWDGYMNAKKAKLEEQFQEAAKFECTNPSTLFNGIAIFVNGYTNPNSEELRRIMLSHGGIYHHYLRPKITTHMIASNLPYSKIIAYRKAANPLPLCKPEWITDSVKEGKVLDFRKYLLYSHTSNQPLMFERMLKQTKSDDPMPSTSTCVSTISNSKQNSELEVLSIEKKSQIQLPTTSNAESSSIISNCTKNPSFLTEFYNNSRLHHIATMGAMFKDYINELRDKSDGSFRGLAALKTYSKKCFKPYSSNVIADSDSDDEVFNNNQYSLNVNPIKSSPMDQNHIIMHIDMDCFFVSVGLRDHPELRGFPIGVTHAKGNKQNDSNDEYGSMSEIASCSYEARKAGVKNGMLLGHALKLCPNLKTIRYNFDGYKEVSYILYNTIASYTLDIEAVSCDEMYVDCTKILQITGLNPLDFATVIRNEIKERTGCPVSTGFGENKLQARLATKKAKPDGQFYLKKDSVKSFISTLAVRDLPGVGYSTNQKLQQMNVQNCADLEAVPLYELQKEFGKKNGQQLYDMCRGIDHNKLNLEHVRKSVSAEVNYGIRFENTEAAHEFLKKLSIEISDRLKKVNLKGKTITLKGMFRAKEAPNEPKKFMGHGDCDVINKSKNLIAPTNDPIVIAREVLNMWNQLQQNPQDARGIGIQITKLESKNKSSESNLLKFITRKNIQEKMENEIVGSIDTNINNEQNKLKSEISNFQGSSRLEKETNLSNKNCNSPNTNRIEKSLKNKFSDTGQSISENLSKDQEVVMNNALKDQSVRDQNSKISSQLKQTKQSEYFKQTKPFIKTNKVKLPDIHEIDMKVLIELPEDIRNEILNEYKECNKTSEEISTDKTCEKPISNQNKPNSSPIIRSHKELSFSQIDPDFIAALPNEIKNEVKSYYDDQKRKKNAKLEEKHINMNHKGWNMFQNEKKPKQSTKLKSKKIKINNVRERKEKNNATSSKTKMVSVVSKKTTKLVPEKISESQVTKDALINKSFYFDPINGNVEHSEILSNIVKCLLDLSVCQVKEQIREWIINNSDVNEVDFLTLTTFLGTLPKKRRLKDLHILLKCLNRIIRETKSCVWHETYKKMLEHIQIQMRLAYGYDIMIPEQIECDKCMIVKV